MDKLLQILWEVIMVILALTHPTNFCGLSVTVILLLVTYKGLRTPNVIVLYKGIGSSPELYTISGMVDSASLCWQIVWGTRMAFQSVGAWLGSAIQYGQRSCVPSGLVQVPTVLTWVEFKYPVLLESDMLDASVTFDSGFSFHMFLPSYQLQNIVADVYTCISEHGCVH